ncbi:MAG TPA: S41 family peptidase [Candidatus Sulfotelmatobacter sp.]|nr:S41 family peptidase [Candidatus Sulfotelmatobacter sp.]
MRMERGSFLRIGAALGIAPLLGAAAAVAEPTFTAEVVRADLDAIWAALLDVGADPFLAADRATVEALYRSTRETIRVPLTVRQAWLAIAPVLGALNDGHVSLGFDGLLAAAARRFPLRFALAPDDALVVLVDESATIPRGSEIVSIDGIAAPEYVHLALAALGGQTESLHRTRVSTEGSAVSFALFGERPTYHVVWKSDGAVHERDVSLATAPSRATTTTSEPYTYGTIAGGGVGYLDYRRCEGFARFGRFLTEAVPAMHDASIKALVVDIRRNGGGDSRLNDELWTAVSSKPFKQFGGVIVKACDRLKREYGEDKYVEIYGARAWSAPDGTIIPIREGPNDDLFTPARDVPSRYTGPVYLLISPQTFSSAMSCALAAKDYGLATIVGEETGEPVDSTGEVYTFTSPGLGFKAYFTTKVFLPPKPQPPRQGVVPDVVVRTTPADVAAGREPVLDRTLALIASA